ncbi:hypothetical protein P2318_11020 [Myxococcaceae bacterium GXIMD 01537]
MPRTPWLSREKVLEERRFLPLVLWGLLTLLGCGGGGVVAPPLPVQARLVFTRQPVGGVAGAALADIEVSLVDDEGRIIHEGGDATLALVDGPADMTLFELHTRAEHGLAVFKGVTLTRAGNGYIFEARFGALRRLSSSFNIVAGPLARLAVAVEPAEEGLADETLRPAIKVTVQDAHGNTRSDSGGEMTVALAGEGATLSGGLTAVTSQGVATFSNLSVDKAGEYRLVFHYGPDISVNSRLVRVLPNKPEALAFLVQPSGAIAGVPIAPAVAVALVDRGGNPVVSASGEVSLSLDAGPGGGLLGGTLTVPLVQGVATFPDLTVHDVAASYRLRATSGSLTGATSEGFDVTAASAPGQP